MFTLAPSILASDMLNLGDEIKKIEKSGAKCYLHYDSNGGIGGPSGYTVSAAGEVATITNQLSGTITGRMIEDGQIVNKGDIL